MYFGGVTRLAKEAVPVSNQRQKLLERTLRACENEYTEKAKIFSDLDGKAQNTTTVAGIFLAAALAFLQGEGLKALTLYTGRNALAILALSIMLLLASILVCLIGMRIRQVPSPVESAELATMVNEILSVSPAEFTDEMEENYFRDQIKAWQTTLKEMSAADDDKAQSVLIGQLLLAAAVVLVAVMLTVVLAGVWFSSMR